MSEDPIDELAAMAQRAARPTGPTWDDAKTIAHQAMTAALRNVTGPTLLDGDVILEPGYVVLYVVQESGCPSVTIREARGGGRAEFVYGQVLAVPPNSRNYVLGAQEEPSPLRFDQVTRDTVLEIVKFWAGLRVFS